MSWKDKMPGLPPRLGVRLLGLTLTSARAEASTPLYFDAVNQRSVTLMAQPWNPVLCHVSKQIVDKYAQREDLRCRVIWTPAPCLDIPLMTHPAVPAEGAEAVRGACIDMHRDPEGKLALRTSTDALSADKPWPFLRVEDKDYDNYRRFYHFSSPSPGRPKSDLAPLGGGSDRRAEPGAQLTTTARH